MLSEIYCDEFKQKKITFGTGLNVVLGTTTGSNSIGKSTFLLIVDFVFGGNTYAKTEDIKKNVGNHDIFFKFIFKGIAYYFCRNNFESGIVWKCNEDYTKVSKMTLLEYCNWLKTAYSIDIPYISFREIVSLYSRIYGKGNYDEKKPLHSISFRKDKDAKYSLLKLFNQYSTILELDKQAKKAKESLDIFKKAQKMLYISNISKPTYEKNEKTIHELQATIEEISQKFNQNLLDIDVIISEKALLIKQQLSKIKKLRGLALSKLKTLEENNNYKFSVTSDNLDELAHFFPNSNLRKLEEIEHFHNQISKVFKKELKCEIDNLKNIITGYNKIIEEYENSLKSLIENPNISKDILEKYSQLLKQINDLKNQNENYLLLDTLKKEKDDNYNNLLEVETKQFLLLEDNINLKMKQLNDYIYDSKYNSPKIKFSNDSYLFFTPNDTGTGIACKGLTVFDLTILQLTCLPILIHDSIILKQISDEAIERILLLYSESKKQIFIALDKQQSYTSAAYNLLMDNCVLELSTGNELFGKAWGGINE